MDDLRNFGGHVGRAIITPMRDADRRLIGSSYVNGRVDALGFGPRSKSPHRGHYLRSIGVEFDRMLDHDSARIAVCRDTEDGALIFGWIYWRDGVVHWVYSKESFRHHGVASALVELAREAGCETYMHSTVKDAWMQRRGLRHFEPRKTA